MDSDPHSLTLVPVYHFSLLPFFFVIFISSVFFVYSPVRQEGFFFSFIRVFSFCPSCAIVNGGDYRPPPFLY